jgi:hypothetical protein
MRWALAAAVALSLSGGQPAPAPGPVPVVVELFTSEGCSSCPPADSLLSKLAAEQSVPGVQIIPLGMHVTYWDQLGWKDPASLQAATDRQQAYGARWGGDRVYTPQAVIDGREEQVGSDEAAVKRAIANAARQPHLTMQLSASLQPDGIHATSTVGNIPLEGMEPTRNVVMITEDGLTSIVRRGENRGRTLRHDAVVRRIVVGKQGLGRIPDNWRRDRLHVTALLQGEKTGRIYAAATIPLK